MGKRHILSQKKKALVAKSLAQKIGYLKIQLPSGPDLPTQDFNAHKIIRPQEQVFIVKQGTVEIWHTRLDMLVTTLEEHSVFGEMPLLGQTMLGCQAIAGSGGVTLGVMDSDRVSELINATPFSILQELGPRLAQLEVEHY